MMKKAYLIALAAALLFTCAVSGCASDSGSGTTAAVQSVAMITDTGSTGVYSSYAGVVTTQKTTEIKKDDNKTVAQIYVEEGQSVEVGQKLFSYNVNDLQLTLDKTKLEVEQLQNSIETYKAQIAQLEKDKKNAAASEQLSYSVQIQSAQADQNEASYNLKVKQADVERMQNAVSNPDVTSAVAGVIQSLNPDGGTDSSTGAALPFMKIVETGAYRVKGTISELAKDALSVGTKVIIRSRLDSSKTWTGTIETIDWDKPASGSASSVYGGSSATDEMTTSSKYPFYVKMDSTDGLMLGQHIYIEPDMGQTQTSADSDALMLPSYYISDADSSPWVWAADGRDRLEKRTVQLGAYNSEKDTYPILSGLTKDDYIAFPDETLTEGMKVTRYDQSTFNAAGSGVTEETSASASGEVVG